MGRQKRLPRRGEAADGHLNLEAAAAERIDAVTAEPLHPTKFVEIMSPDGTLRLFYNTATLIRIATDKGMFMQPPHFRERMAPSLVKRVEKVEGRTFRFEKSNNVVHDDVDVNAPGVHVLHRHVYFDQIMDEFYLLNPAELYVCPSCFLHWIETRMIPHLTATRQRIEYVEGDPNPVIDPLDVLAHMQGVDDNTAFVETGDTTEEAENLDNERVPLTIPSTDLLPNWDSPMVHVVFRRALAWKRHVRRHHSDTRTAAADYRLKDFLSHYISQYNRLSEEKCKKSRRRGYAADVAVPTLTVSRYWHVNARYNRLRYNRIVEAVERAEPHINECVEQTAFPGEEVANTFHSNDKVSSESDFICDSESSSSSGSGGGYGRFPRYEWASEATEEDEVEVAKTGRKRRRSGESTSSSSSSSSSSISSSAVCGSNEESGEDDDEEEGEEETDAEDVDGKGAKMCQRQLFKKGILAPFSAPYRKLSYEERRVLDANSKRVFKPTSLYVPTEQLNDNGYYDDDGDDSDGAGEKEEETIDWAQFGGTIDGAAVYVRDLQQRYANTAVLGKQNNNGEMTGADDRVKEITPIRLSAQKLLLDDDFVPTATTALATPTPTPGKQCSLLLDSSD